LKSFYIYYKPRFSGRWWNMVIWRLLTCFQSPWICRPKTTKPHLSVWETSSFDSIRCYPLSVSSYWFKEYR